MAGVLCRARLSNAACVRAVLIPACGVGMWLQGSQSAAALEPRAVGGTPQRSGADRLASEPPNTIEEGPLASGLAVGPTGPTGFATAYATSYSCAFEFQPCDLARFSGVSCATGSSCTAVGTAVANTTLAESWAGTKWTIEPTPSPDNSASSNLASVSCTAATACLAVGSYYSSLGSGWLPLAELWNGSSWTIRPPPTPSEGSNDILSYVQCATAKACMAVGSYYSSATSQTVPLVEFWDGSAWTIQTVSLPSGASGGQLFGVSCPSMTACTAVGIYYTALGGPSEELALAESWNGTNWSLQPTPNPISNASYSLNAVWCLSATSCNAVGRLFTGSNEETLAESWDGTTWSIRPTPNPSASTYSYLANLSCDPSGVPCKAVGTSGNETLVESWDGTTWSTQTTPQPANSTSSSFSDVSCTAANACTAVGQYLDSTEGPTGAYRTLAERWDGTNWTAQPTADAALAGTESATNITSSTAELNGTVYPGGAPTTCYFEYGTTSSYGSTIACAQSTGPGAASVAVSADLTGLSPNTTYYFTLVATNPGSGMTYTPGPASFTTLATSGGGGGGSGGVISPPGGSGGVSGSSSIHHYRVELKAWIPYDHVVDPFTPFEPTQYIVAKFTEPVCHVASFFSQLLTNVISLYRGDGQSHTGYAGGFRVLSSLEFDWDGSRIANFHEAAGPHYGTTHRDINQNGPDGAYSCTEQKTATSDVRVQQTGSASFAMSIDSKNPIPPQSVTPAIDSTLTGSFQADGGLALKWQSDLFPSHGFYVEEDGKPALTAVTNNPAGCMSEADTRGPLGAQRLAFGLLHPDNMGQVVLPANGLGLVMSQGASLLCSEDDLSTLLPDVSPSALIASAGTARSARTVVTASQVINGKQTDPVSLATAGSQGWLTQIPNPAGLGTVVLSSPTAPIVLHIPRMPFTVQEIGASTTARPQAYFPKGTVTATLGSEVVVQTVKGRRLAPLKTSLAPPVIKTHVDRRHGQATITFRITSGLPVKALYVSVGGGHFHALRGRKLRVPIRKLRAVSYYSTNVLGAQSKAKTL